MAATLPSSPPSFSCLPAPAPHLYRFCLPFWEVQASHQRLGALWKPTTTSCGQWQGGQGQQCEGVIGSLGGGEQGTVYLRLDTLLHI